MVQIKGSVCPQSLYDFDNNNDDTFHSLLMNVQGVFRRLHGVLD